MITGPGADGSRGYTAEQGLKAVLGGENIDAMNRWAVNAVRYVLEDIPVQNPAIMIIGR